MPLGVRCLRTLYVHAFYIGTQGNRGVLRHGAEARTTSANIARRPGWARGIYGPWVIKYHGVLLALVVRALAPWEGAPFRLNGQERHTASANLALRPGLAIWPSVSEPVDAVFARFLHRYAGE